MMDAFFCIQIDLHHKNGNTAVAINEFKVRYTDINMTPMSVIFKSKFIISILSLSNIFELHSHCSILIFINVIVNHFSNINRLLTCQNICFKNFSPRIISLFIQILYYQKFKSRSVVNGRLKYPHSRKRCCTSHYLFNSFIRTMISNLKRTI